MKDILGEPLVSVGVLSRFQQLQVSHLVPLVQVAHKYKTEFFVRVSDLEKVQPLLEILSGGGRQ